MRPIAAAQLQAQRSFSPRARVSVEARAWGDFDQRAYGWEVISRRLPPAVLAASVNGSSFNAIYSATIGLPGGLACRVFQIPNSARAYIQRGIDPNSANSWETTAIEKEYPGRGNRPAPPALYVDGSEIQVNLLRRGSVQYARYRNGVWDASMQTYPGGHGATINSGFRTASNSGYGRLFVTTKTRGDNRPQPLIFELNDQGRLSSWSGGGVPGYHRVVGVRLHASERRLTVYTLDVDGDLWAFPVVDRVWGTPEVMDDPAVDDARYGLVCFGPGPGGWIFWRQEKLGSVYDAVGVVQGDQPVVSEALLWPGWLGAGLIDKAGIHPVKIGDDYYLVAADFVARAVLLPAAARALPTPIKYEYRQKIVGLEQNSLQGEGSSGRAEFIFPAHTVVDAGELLLVRRRLEAPSGQGAVSLIYLWVVAVESERSEVRVVAVDPVGLLGVVRPRVGIRFHIRRSVGGLGAFALYLHRAASDRTRRSAGAHRGSEHDQSARRSDDSAQ